MVAPRETLRTILTPWCVALAVLGIAEAAFVGRLLEGQDRSGWSGTDVSVWVTDGPLRRAVAVQWTSEFVDDPAPSWEEEGGAMGVYWIRGGGNPVDGTPPARGRPPGAVVQYASVQVGLLWCLGLPVLGSILLLWRSVRRRAARPDEADAGRRPGPLWRLARPWVWTFAPVGLLLVIGGGEQDDAYTRALGLPPFSAQVSPAAPSAQPTRSLFVWQSETVPAPAGREAEPTTETILWGDPRWGVSGKRYRSSWTMRRAAYFHHVRGILLSVWWLIAVAAAGNAVTLVGLARSNRLARRGAAAGTAG
ncbi:hypothetical protein [Alienimonas sp. DA493]|uniref:hypothetical protein n=1 Tax=Alienimonas sp. DA493 TaxID=3373605 RepID=UPI003754B800